MKIRQEILIENSADRGKMIKYIEEQIEVKTIQVNLTCPECNKGFLIWDGITIFTQIPCYDHFCSNCNHRRTFKGTDKTYPYIKYIKI